MTLTRELPPSLSRTGADLLSQYLMRCPRCTKTGAVHLDERSATPVLVRFVCLDGCHVEEGEVLQRLPGRGARSPAGGAGSAGRAGSSFPPKESSMHVDPAVAASADSDFHLVESRGEWRLTIRMSDRLLTALTAAAATRRTGGDVHFTVHVEPNLLPGQPFEVAVDVTDDHAVRTNDERAH